MIEMTRESGISAPVFLCDVCKKPILFVGRAAVVFSRDLKNGERVPAMIVHKGACHDAAEQALGDAQGISSWLEFGDVLQRMLDTGPAD